MAKTNTTVSDENFKQVEEALKTHPALAHVTPATARRFFVDRKGNVGQTISYLEKNERWREQMDLDNLNIAHVQDQLRTGKFLFPGIFDKKNRPIIIFNAAKHDPKVDFMKTLTLAAYAFELAIKSLPEGVEQLVVIEDLTGFTTDNADNRMVKYLLEILQCHYPGRVAKFYAVNAPWYYKVVFKVVKPWLPNDLLELISVDSDCERLQKDIAKDNLTKALGGDIAFNLDSWIQRRYEIEGLDPSGTPAPLKIAPELLATFSDLAAKDLIPTCRKHGWLKKQGGYVKTFNKRYCILTDLIFYYYKEKDDPKPEGFVELTNAHLNLKKGNVFDIVTSVEKVCIFSAKDSASLKEWTAEIGETIKGLSTTAL